MSQRLSKPFWPPALASQAPPAIILAVLHHFRGPALFRGLRPSSRQGVPFWPSGLTLRSSGPAFCGPLTLAVERQLSSKLNGNIGSRAVVERIGVVCLRRPNPAMSGHAALTRPTELVHTLVTTTANASDVRARSTPYCTCRSVLCSVMRGLPGRREASREPGQDRRMAGGDEAQLAQGSAGGRTGAATGSVREAQHKHPGEGRASLLCDQEPAPPPQDPIPRAGEERGATVLDVWLNQSGARQQAYANGSWPRCGLRDGIRAKTPSKIKFYA